MPRPPERVSQASACSTPCTPLHGNIAIITISDDSEPELITIDDGYSDYNITDDDTSQVDQDVSFCLAELASMSPAVPYIHDDSTDIFAHMARYMGSHALNMSVGIITGEDYRSWIGSWRHNCPLIYDRRYPACPYIDHLFRNTRRMYATPMLLHHVRWTGTQPTTRSYLWYMQVIDHVDSRGPYEPPITGRCAADELVRSFVTGEVACIRIVLRRNNNNIRRSHPVRVVQ